MFMNSEAFVLRQHNPALPRVFEVNGYWINMPPKQSTTNMLWSAK